MPGAKAIHKHLPRYREIASVLLEEGFEPMLRLLGLARFAPVARRVAPTLRHAPERSAEERARRALERLGPAFVKTGQILSTRPDLIPLPFAEEFRRLQDRVTEFPYDEVCAVVHRELGESVEEAFEEFDPAPLAAASIGQVHAAVLPGGERVAVKVQRPGIDEVVGTDLDILLTQAHFLEDHAEWARRYRAVANAEEFARILLGELDYIQEARNAEKLREDFRGEEGMVVPAIHWSHTTRRVITMERLDGICLNRRDEILAAGYDLRDIAEKGISLYLEMIFVNGFFHADPHPGNLFVMPGARIGFTDFGRAGSIGGYAKDRFGDLFLAVMERDGREVVDVLLEVGVASPGFDEIGLTADVSSLLHKYYDATLGQIRLAELIRELMGLTSKYRLSMPPEFTLLLSTLAILEGVGQELDPSFNFVEATRPFASRVLKERLLPRGMLLTMVKASRLLNKILVDTPQLLVRVLQKGAEGVFRVEVAPRGFEELVDDLREMVNRLAFAILVGSFVVGFSLLLRGTDLPGWLTFLAQIGLVAAGGVGLWMFLSIFWFTIRHRFGSFDGRR